MTQLKDTTHYSIAKKQPFLIAGSLYTILLIICFFPLFFGNASLNWDAFDLWMPWKHFIVEEFYAGDLPLWNPYFRDGFPQHGDTMTWYPISWAIGFLFGGYNLHALNVDYLLHLLVAGTGMFALTKRFYSKNTINFLLGLSFMLSGFMIGNAQHISWIISAAWIPWYFLAIFQLRDKQQIKQLLHFAVVGYLLFSGGYLAIFFVLVYLTLLLLIWFYFNRASRAVTVFYRYFAVGVLLIALLSLPLLLSAFELFPLFNRFQVKDVSVSLDIHLGATPWNGILSILFPLSSGIYNVPETEFGTFSTYFGLVPFLLLVAKFKTIYINRRFLFLFIIALLALMCSMGDVFPIRKIVSLLPLLDLFRYPALFRLFSIFIALVLLAMVLERSPLQKSIPTSSTERWGLITTGVLLLITSGYLLMHSEVLTNLSYFKTIPYIKPLENTSFIDRLGLNLGILGMLLTGLSIWWFRKKYVTFNSFLFLVWGLELLVVVATSAPHTVYHPINVPWANHIIRSQPLEHPPLISDHAKQEVINWKDYLGFSWQSKTFYTKQFSSLWYNPLHINSPTVGADVIPIHRTENTPIIGRLVMDSVGKMSVVKDETISLKMLSNQHWTISYPSTLPKGSVLFIKQHYVPEWEVISEKGKLPLKQSDEGFLLLEVDPSEYTTFDLVYTRSPYLITFWISLSLFCLFLFILLLVHPNKWLWFTTFAVLFILGFLNNRPRIFAQSSEEISEYNTLTRSDFETSMFSSNEFWKQKSDTLYVPTEIPKTDQEIAYLQLNAPTTLTTVKINDVLYQQRIKKSLDQPITAIASNDDPTRFQFDLHTVLRQHQLFDKVLLLSFNYSASQETALQFWIAHKREGKWINGNAWPLSSSVGSTQQHVSAVDISSYDLLPSDELTLFVWGEEDPQFSWKDFSIHVITAP